MIKESKRWCDASTLKKQTYTALNDLRHAKSLGRVFGVSVFVLIILNAVLVFVETQPNLPARVIHLMMLFGLVSSVFFCVEYIARLWVADLVYHDRKPYRARLHYALSPMGVIDLLSFLPGLLVLLVPISPSALNAARIIRLIRLVKLSRYMRGLYSISTVFRKRRQEIFAASMVLALLMITASVLMYEFEHPVQPDKFDSVFTGMYWAITTITTTGYGDLVPITAAGRFVGFCTMVLSIAVVAIPAGIFSAGFVAEFHSQDVQKRERKTRGAASFESAEDGDDSLEGCEDSLQNSPKEKS